MVSPLATIVRPARPSDKTPLMEFISRIWGGHDYIPSVWDEWIRDRSARTFVVEVDGKPVGMNRVKFLEDGNAWLEGARVHPSFRGTGLASLLGRDAIRAAAKSGKGVVRLATNSRNKSARRQITKMGFAELARMSVYNPGTRSRFGHQRGVRLAARSDLTSLVGSIRSSREFKVGGGVFWDGFRATALTAGTINRAVRERRVYLSDGAAAIFKRGAEGDDPFLQICFACGNQRDVVKLIKHTFGRRLTNRKSERFLCAPQGSPLISTARKAGLVRWASFILFQRSSANG